jgi:hypothetical protein
MSEGVPSLWTTRSLDAVLLSLWSLLVIGAATSLLLKELVDPKIVELIAQLNVVGFIGLSAYRMGVNYRVDARVWFPAAYFSTLIYSLLYRKVGLRVDVFIEHVFYAMMGFVCILSVVTIDRYYRPPKKKRTIPGFGSPQPKEIKKE